MKWYAGSSSGQGLVADEDTGANIAVTYDEAHADLVAAAPDMYDALQDAEFLLRKLAINWREAGSMTDSCKRAADDALAALSKASQS